MSLFISIVQLCFDIPNLFNRRPLPHKPTVITAYNTSFQVKVQKGRILDDITVHVILNNKVLLFLHHCLFFRCWAAVTLCYGSKQYFMFLSSGMHIFKHFYLLTLASRGTLPSVFGVKCKSCYAETSIC